MSVGPVFSDQPDGVRTYFHGLSGVDWRRRGRERARRALDNGAAATERRRGFAWDVKRKGAGLANGHRYHQDNVRNVGVQAEVSCKMIHRGLLSRCT